MAASRAAGNSAGDAINRFRVSLDKQIARLADGDETGVAAIIRRPLVDRLRGKSLHQRAINELATPFRPGRDTPAPNCSAKLGARPLCSPIEPLFARFKRCAPLHVADGPTFDVTCASVTLASVSRIVPRLFLTKKRRSTERGMALQGFQGQLTTRLPACLNNASEPDFIWWHAGKQSGLLQPESMPERWRSFVAPNQLLPRSLSCSSTRSLLTWPLDEHERIVPRRPVLSRVFHSSFCFRLAGERNARVLRM